MKHSIRLTRLVRLLSIVLLLFSGGWSFQSAPLVAAVQPLRIGGPDAFNFGFTDSTEPSGPTYAWRTTATGTNLNLTDASTAVIQAPFPILLYDLVTTTLHVSNNGIIRVGNGPNMSDVNQSLNEINAPNHVVAAFWDDLDTAWTKGVSYDTLGTAPNRQFVIWWEMMPHFPATSNTVDFQVIFTENSDAILFQYQDVLFGTPPEDSGASATVGIRGANRSKMLQYSFNEPALNAGLAIRFYRLPPAANLVPTNATQSARPNSTALYPLTLTNWTEATRTFTVTYEGSPFTASGINTFTLANGASQVFTATVVIPADAALGTVGVNTVSVTTDDPQFATSATLTTTAALVFACSGVPVTVPSGFAAGVSGIVAVDQVPVVGNVTVDLALDTPFVSTNQSLSVDLISPNGTKVRLHNFSANPVTGNYTQTLTVDGPGQLSDVAGEYANGSWLVHVVQPVAGATTTLKGCRLNFSPPPAGVFLSPPRRIREVAAGTTVEYGYRLVNNTPQTQTVALNYTNSFFPVTGPSTLTVPFSNSAVFTASLLVEPNARPLMADELIVTATSQTSVMSATATTMVVPPTWTHRAVVPTRGEAFAVATLNGSVVVLGGRRPSSSTAVDFYNPQTNVWSSGPALPVARAFAGAAVLSDTLYLVGGEQLIGQPQSTVFTLRNGAWTIAPSLPQPLSGSVVVADPLTNRLFVFGGRINSTTNVSTTLMFDGTNWVSKPPIPVPFGGLNKAAGTRLGREVYITGGEYSGAAQNKQLFIYSLDTHTWRFGPPLPEPRIEAGMAVAGQVVCVVGGANVQVNPAIQATAWCFDPVDERWFRAANLNVARQRLAVTQGPDGIYAIGGLGGTDSTCNSTNPRICQTVERYAPIPARFHGSSKAVTPTIMLSSEIATYTLTISNSGQLAATAYLTDTVDPHLGIIDLSPELQANGNQLTASLLLKPNETRTLTFTAAATEMTFAGVITNSLELSGDGNLYSFDAPPLTIYVRPTSIFVDSSTPDTLGQTTVFTAGSDGSVTGYRWDFGDGAIGIGQTTNHQYTAAGTYSVTLFVDWGAGSTQILTTAVEIYPLPTIMLNSSSPDPLGWTTYFTPTVTGKNLTYAWDFGDGTTSNIPQPVHLYATTGHFTVTVTITDSNGVAASSSTIVEIDPAPSAAISLSSNPLLIGRTLVVTGTSGGVGTTYAWEFGDGATATGSPASHQYAHPGSYTITLVVTDRNGITTTTTVMVAVRAALWLPVMRK